MLLSKRGQCVRSLWIWDHLIIDAGCPIGYRVRIHCTFMWLKIIVIEDAVFMALGVKIADNRYPVSERFGGL